MARDRTEVRASTDPAHPTAAPRQPWTVALNAGTSAVITRGERKEYITARAELTAPITSGLSAFARGDLGGTQDGGGLDYFNPKTFRTIECAAGLSYKVKGINLGALGGVTWSVEGDTGKPIDSRLFTLAGVARLGIGDGGYVYVGGGHHGPVGGPALLGSASIPIKGGAFTTFDLAFPLTRTVFEEKAWCLKVGATVRVKRFGL